MGSWKDGDVARGPCLVRLPAGDIPLLDATDGAMGRELTERELEAFHPDSFGWALTCCRFDRDEAEEVLQASYLKAIDGRARFNGHSSMRTWFFGVVKRTAAEQRRRRAVRDVALLRWLRKRPAGHPVPTPEGLSDEAETRKRLKDLLSRLSTRQRELLHLVFYQEVTIEEAAGILQIAVGTARRHYERGKQRLRTLLAKQGVSR